MAGETLEKTVFSAELDDSAMLAAYQRVSAAHRAWLQSLGDSPAVQEQLKSLDDFDAKLTTMANNLQTAGQAGRQAADGIDAAGQAGDKSHKPIDNTRAAVAHLGTQLAGIVGVAPQAGSALMQLTTGAIAPQVAGVMLLVAAIQTLMTLYGKWSAAQDKLIQQTHEAIAASSRLTESIFQEQRARAAASADPKDSASLVPADYLLTLMKNTDLNESEAAAVADAAKKAGIPAATLEQFGRGVRLGMFTADDSGARRFASRQKKDELGLYQNIIDEWSKYESDPRRYYERRRETQDLIQKAETASSPKARALAALQAAYGSEKGQEIFDALEGRGPGMSFSSRRERVRSLAEDEAIQQALGASGVKAQLLKNVPDRAVFININSPAFQVNQDSTNGRTPAMGSTPRFRGAGYTGSW